MSDTDQIHKCLDHLTTEVLPRIREGESASQDELRLQASVFEAKLPLGEDYERMNRLASRLVTCIASYYTQEVYTVDEVPDEYESINELTQVAVEEVRDVIAAEARRDDTPDYEVSEVVVSNLANCFSVANNAERLPVDGVRSRIVEQSNEDRH